MRCLSPVLISAILLVASVGETTESGSGESDDDDFEELDEDEDEIDSPASAEAAWDRAVKDTLDENAEVVTLTKGNFDKFVGKTERVLVDFYAPWCNHCKDLEPEWEKAAKDLRKEGVQTRLAKCDAVGEGMSQYVVEGYPTLLLFVNGKRSEHVKVDYKAAAIKEHVRTSEFATVTTLREEGLDDYLSKIDYPGRFVLVATVKKNSVRHKAFKAAFDELKDSNMTASIIRGAVVLLPGTADAKADAKLFLWRPGFVDPDEQRHDFKGSWTGANIAKWARLGLYGRVNRFFEGNLWDQKMVGPMGFEGLVAAFMDDDTAGDSAVMQQVANQLADIPTAQPRWQSLLLKVSDTDEMALKYFNPTNLSWPILASIAFVAEKKYAVSGRSEMTKPNAVSEFVAAVRSKKLTPLKFGVAPPTRAVDGNGMTTLVADTFDSYVMDPTKDVIVDFSTPDCEHCKELDPIWADVAKKAKKSKWLTAGLVVAKIDIRANQVEEETTIVPKIVLYPAVKADRKVRERKVYTGARKFDRIVQFIEENARTLGGGEEEEEL